MIKLLRIDNRLIHGQIAVGWIKHLEVNRVIVANDKIAQNNTQVATLKMATPDGVKCLVISIKDAIEILNDSRADKLIIMIIVNNPADALKIIEAVPKVPYLNLGNYGQLGSTEGLVKLSETFYCDEDDVSVLKNIKLTGKKIEYQLVPNHAPRNLSDKI